MDRPALYPEQLEEIHYRLLWLVYRHPNGISVARLIKELKARGWCEPELTAADLGLHPGDLLRPPRAAANDP
jgi:hypothetical protein